MPTTTDLTTDDKRIVYRDPLPSAAFDGANDSNAVNARYRELFAQLDPSDRAARDALMEDQRRAHVRAVVLRGSARYSSRTRDIQGDDEDRLPMTASQVTRKHAVHIGVAQVIETDDGHVIDCRVCEERKPINKFPTLRLPKGVPAGTRPDRGDVCRACRDLAVSKAKENGQGA